MEFIGPLLSNLLFVFFAISIFSYRKSPNFFIDLPVRYILIFVAVKLIAYYFVSQMPQNDETMGDYYVINFLLFEGGILLANIFRILSFGLYHLKTEVSLQLLSFSLFFDYLVFLLLSIIRRRRKGLKKARKRTSEG